jgi:hypothetical protein
MNLLSELNDPNDDDARVPDAGRPRPVFWHAVYVLAVASVIVRAIGYLLRFLVMQGGWFQSSGAAVPAWAAQALHAMGPAVPMIFLVVVAAALSTITTTDWNADDRGGVRMLTFIGSLIVGALFLLPLPGSRTARGADSVTARAVESAGLDPLQRAIDRPVELRVEQADGVLSVRPTLEGTLAGHYLVRSRVTVAATGAELAHHARDLDLPRYAAFVGDTYPIAELEQGYARWLGQPGASDGRIGGVLRCTCTAEVHLLAATSTVERATYARMSLPASLGSLSAPVTLRLLVAGRQAPP